MVPILKIPKSSYLFFYKFVQLSVSIKQNNCKKILLMFGVKCHIKIKKYNLF